MANEDTSPAELAKKVDKAYEKAEALLESALAAHKRGASPREIERLETNYAEAWAEATDLRDELLELVSTHWQEYEDMGDRLPNPAKLRRNGLFGTLFSDGAKRGSRRAASAAKRKYYVDYEDPAGHVRQLLIRAESKADARAKAKEQLSDEYGSFAGGKWNIELAD
jgi:hypothetical protein